jgi:hypothetical protein
VNCEEVELAEFPPSRNYRTREEEAGAILYALHNFSSVERQIIAWIKLTNNPTWGPGFRNIWLEKKGLRVYVRKSRRSIGGIPIQCLDIASVELQTRQRGKGRFTSFLQHVANINPWDAIYFESVNNEWLWDSFRRRGYYEIKNPSAPSFLFFTNKSVEAKFDEPKPAGRPAKVVKKGGKK